MSRTIRRADGDATAPLAPEGPGRQRSLLADLQEAPYSLYNEVRYFFVKGLPLGAAAVLSNGIPPLVSMAFAGQTENSAHLQTSLGYGRLWYNITGTMVINGCVIYCASGVSGCVGAGRKDRIPQYVHRSLLMTYLFLLPFLALQFAADRVMCAMGVPESNADEMGIYCRVMVGTLVLQVIDQHLGLVFNSLGFAGCSAAVSLVSGIGLQIGCTYALVLHWNLGVVGFALAQVVVRLGRILLWSALIGHYRLGKYFCSAQADGQRLWSRSEGRLFASLAFPQYGTYLAGWLVFELQVLLLAHIHGVSRDGLAAGAIWVQMETAFAAAQTGWIQGTAIRCLVLLGKQDPDAFASLKVAIALATSAIAVLNILLLVCHDLIAQLLSNDDAVQSLLSSLLWVLALHLQTRIVGLMGLELMIPLRRGGYRVAITFISHYLLGMPFAFFVGMTDVVTTSVNVKIACVLGNISIAHLGLAFFSFCFYRRLDWTMASHAINSRANSDRREVSVAPVEPDATVEMKPRAADTGAPGNNGPVLGS